MRLGLTAENAENAEATWDPRAGSARVDRAGAFAAVQARSRGFVWDAAMQARADSWASREMVGWIEEVHKALEVLSARPCARPGGPA